MRWWKKWFHRNRRDSESHSIDRIIGGCLGGLIIILFFGFLPWFSNRGIEHLKMAAGGILVFATSILWIGRGVLRKEARVVFGKVDCLVILFGFVLVVSTVFSQDSGASLGLAALTPGSLLGAWVLILLYFLVVNTVSRTQVRTWLMLLLGSGFAIVLFHLPRMAGIRLFPFLVGQPEFFNLVAPSISTFGILLVFLFILGVGMLVQSEKVKRRILAEIILGGILVLLFVIEGKFLLDEIGWILLAAGLLFWTILLSFQSRKIGGFSMLVTATLLLASVVLWFVSSALPFSKTPTVALDFRSGGEIAFSSLRESFFFGSGPETFRDVFSAHRLLSWNNNPFWALRFEQSHDEILDLLSTIGFVGTLIFVLIGVVVIMRAVRGLLLSKTVNEQWWIEATVLAGFFVLFLSSFLHPFRATTAFFYWFFLAILVGMSKKKERERNLERSPAWNLSFSLLFAGLLAGGIVFFYLGIRVLLAETRIEQSRRIIEQSRDFGRGREELRRAIRLSPSDAGARLAFVENLAVSAQIVAGRGDEPTASGFIQEAMTEIQKTLERHPRNVFLIERFAESLEPLLELGGEEIGRTIPKLYEKATILDPRHPKLWFLWGRWELLRAQAMLNGTEESKKKQGEEELKTAIEKLKKTTELKTNFVEAEILLARGLELQGQRQEAIERLSFVLTRLPLEPLLLEETGRMLFQEERVSEAEALFDRLLAIVPNHANAHFYRAEIYERRGEKDQAIRELQVIQKTNPDHEFLKEKLRLLAEKP